MSRTYHGICRLRQMCSTFHTSKMYCTSSEDKQPEHWRIPWAQKKREWYSSLSLFAPNKGMSPDIIKFLQSPIDFRPEAIRNWWRRKQETHAIMDQMFIPERHDMLGNDLATAHFIVHRNGSVKFHDQTDWVKKDEDDEHSLPDKYVPNLFLEAIDASNMQLHYEGLENVVRLRKLKWLSLKNCPHMDDWCLDRISSEFQATLEYLDIGYCQQVSERGLSVLHRLQKLETLKVHEIPSSKPFELTCLMLEDFNPKLKIEGVTYMQIDHLQ